jgi:hypothetical protein
MAPDALSARALTPKTINFLMVNIPSPEKAAREAIGGSGL